MRPLRLDLVHPFPRPHWSAWLLLAAGIALAAWSGWQGMQAQRDLSEAVAAAPTPTARAGRAPVRAVPGTEENAARAARDQLAVPWGDLFLRLEKTRPRRIALVALEADARKAEATLTAEARSVKDMLAYIDQLKKEAGFGAVTLASHALQESAPQQPLRFVVRLVWRT
jgi:hypothetical protein